MVQELDSATSPPSKDVLPIPDQFKVDAEDLLNRYK